jgi:peptidoglycan L-alanyl-D-glutamate endopeptidase CwlK
MTYFLGKRSRSNLEGVHPVLLGLVEEAIKITTQDFTVLDGPRTLAEQKEYVAKGVSKTMKSHHLVKSDGFGYAVDLVPYINGQPRWEWMPTCHVAFAMTQVSNRKGVPIRWGGCWELISPNRANQFASPDMLKARVDHYVSLRRSQRRSAFIDGPHFEYRPDLA